MGERWELVLLGAGALLLLYPFLKLLLTPVRLVIKILANGVLGFILLWLINTLASAWGFFLPVNPVTILVTGFLGIPGILLLAALKYFMVI